MAKKQQPFVDGYYIGGENMFIRHAILQSGRVLWTRDIPRLLAHGEAKVSEFRRWVKLGPFDTRLEALAAQEATFKTPKEVPDAR